MSCSVSNFELEEEEDQRLPVKLQCLSCRRSNLAHNSSYWTRSNYSQAQLYTLLIFEASHMYIVSGTETCFLKLCDSWEMTRSCHWIFTIWLANFDGAVWLLLVQTCWLSKQLLDLEMIHLHETFRFLHCTFGKPKPLAMLQAIGRLAAEAQ